MPVDSNIYASPRVYHKNKAKTGVLTAHKKQGNNITKNKGSQCYCVMRKKAVITERKYKYYI